MSTPAAGCPACGAPLPGSARFCPGCGQPVAADDVHRVDGSQSRRTVTLLFTDVTGSTALGEALDPEALRSVMGRYFEVARVAVERHGGTVEKFVGDAVLAVFGLARAREDDALRAVRAAMEVHDAVAALSDELAATLGVRLEIRTGVNTGSVVTGAARAGGSFATGDAVNTAARLEQLAGPGEVLLGADTHTLVRDAVQVGPERAVLAKGKAEPVPAWPLLGLVEDATEGRARRHDAPLAAREYELRVLTDALARTASTGRGHLATVLGGPGLGKTRLVAELADRGGATVLHGRCISYGAGLSTWPLTQALRSGLGLSGGEPHDVVRKALRGPLGDAADADAVAERLLPLLVADSLPVGQDDVSWAVSRLLEQLARSGPVLLVVDDLHRAEAGLVDLLDALREEIRDLPVLLVAAARSELLDRHPGWGSGAANAVVITLEPLDEEAALEVAAARLGGPADPATAAAVTRWSGGNPLFVQELVAHLRDAGRLVERDGTWTLTEPEHGAELPPSVGALLGARIDALGEPERRLLERMSVIGLEATAAEAAALADDGSDVAGLLGSLARRDLLRRVRSGAGDTWSFRHVLVREAAYDRLPKAQRAALHERFADHLLTRAGDLGADRVVFVAHHLEQAGRLSRDVAGGDARTNALVVRAVEALLTANQVARDREDVATAAELLRRAEDLRSPDAGQRRLVLLRQVCHHQQHFEAAAARAANARLAAEVGDDGSLDALVVAAARTVHAMDVGGAFDPLEARRAAEAVLARATEGTRWHELMGLLLTSECCAVAARWREIRTYFRRIVEIGDVQDRRQAQGWTLLVLLYGPFPATELLEFARHAMTAPVAPRSRARLLLAEAIAAAALDLPGAADLVAERATSVADFSETEQFVHLHAAEAYYLLGDLSAAAATAERGVRIMTELGDFGHASTYQAWWARVLLEDGADVEQVRPLVEQAAGWTSPHDVVSLAEVAAARAVIAAATGDVTEALRAGEEAIRVIDASEMVQTQADLRRCLAGVHLAAGDRDSARRLLEEAVALYEQKEFHGMVRRTRELLAGLQAG